LICWHPNGSRAISESPKLEKCESTAGRSRKPDRYDGKWVVETNDDTISLEDATCGYRGLMVIERCFGALKKTRIKMSHFTIGRIEAHVKICTLTLLIERVAELRSDRPRSRIAHDLQEVQISYFSKSRHRFYRRNQLTDRVLRL